MKTFFTDRELGYPIAGCNCPTCVTARRLRKWQKDCMDYPQSREQEEKRKKEEQKQQKDKDKKIIIEIRIKEKK